MKWMIFVVCAALVSVGCDSGGHGHDHGEHDDHGHDDHGGHAGHDDHGDDHHGPHDGHDHGDHDHGDETVGWTSYGQKTQMFTEYAPLHGGELSKFRIHVTMLDGWQPLAEGEVKVLIETDGQKAKGTAQLAAPGIWTAEVAPRKNGSGKLTVTVGDLDVHTRDVSIEGEGDHDDQHDGHDDEGHDHDSLEPIEFLLEQQWSIEFGLAEVKPGEVRPTFDAFGTLEPRLGGEGVVYANSRGRISGESIPTLGQAVKRGDTLAWLTPSLAEQGDFASMDLALRQAQTRLKAAQVERNRLAKLVSDGVIPQRRLTDAEFAVEQAQSEVSAARSRLGQARGVTGTGSRPAGSIALKAPIDGVIVGVDVPPGLIVEAGRPLFRIVDPDPLWLRVEVPEVHISRLDTVTGVWFTVGGFENAFELYDTPIAVGGTVSPESRTLPVIAEVPNPGGRLRPGMFADVHVVQGRAAEALIVPKAAVVFEEGVPVAYAAVNGETFERRPLRLGPRTAEGFVVERGLDAGEWVVTDGAFAVRLASLGDAATNAGHGHPH